MKTISKAEIAEMYSRLTVTALAKELGISRPTAYRLLKDAGVDLRGQIKIKLVD